jgi:peptidoglycan-associated lipoprotein
MRFFRIAALTLTGVAACAHNEPAPTPAAAPQPAPQPAAAAPAPTPAPAQEAPRRQVQPASVYFAFDSSELSGDARSTLQSLYDELRDRNDVAVRIEGNCDERGAREYNLALGQRRADAAKDYLVRLGFPASRVTTVSNGKEKPRATGHDEQAWQENRRVDLIPRQQSVGQLVR